MNKFSQLPTMFLMVLSLGLLGPVQAVELDTQTNREGTVTVKVTPRNISSNAGSWDFEVSLSTHSVTLDQDMTRAAFLVVDSGKPQVPKAWEGAPPGGHHRKGTLKFQSPSAMPRQIELQINGIGGVNQRMFRWLLK